MVHPPPPSVEVLVAGAGAGVSGLGLGRWTDESTWTTPAVSNDTVNGSATSSDAADAGTSVPIPMPSVSYDGHSIAAYRCDLSTGTLPWARGGRCYLQRELRPAVIASLSSTRLSQAPAVATLAASSAALSAGYSDHRTTTNAGLSVPTGVVVMHRCPTGPCTHGQGQY